MEKAKYNPKFIGILALVIVIAALALGISGFKLKSKTTNQNTTNIASTNTTAVTNTITNSSTLTNTAMKTYTNPGKLADEKIMNKQARIVTNKGTIVFTLDAKQSPLAVSSFVYLAEQNYFDGLTWHRVVDDFVIQGGDPTGTGRGGPGYQFPDETVTSEYVEGTVAMANSGPNTNGSQFFICNADDTQKLAKSYSIFGHVTSGLDVVKKIVQGDTMQKVTIEPVS